jgi:hypothetical protein
MSMNLPLNQCLAVSLHTELEASMSVDSLSPAQVSNVSVGDFGGAVCAAG